MSEKLSEALGEALALAGKATPGIVSMKMRPDESIYVSIGEWPPGPHAQGDVHLPSDDVWSMVQAVNLLRQHGQAIAAVLRAVEGDAWQPIETAPHTGIAVLLWQPWKSGRDCTTIGHYANGWCDRFNEEMRPEPTHWRPLPASPLDAAGSAEGRGDG